MSNSYFSVTEHTIPCQHIRGYPNAAKDEHAVLHLAIKEYRPVNNLNAETGSVTIIATHANGFPKVKRLIGNYLKGFHHHSKQNSLKLVIAQETYEPLWEDLVKACSPVKIRAIWIADSSNQGASGVLNENIQGDDRESIYRVFLYHHLKESSVIFRPFSRSARHGKSFPRSNDPTNYRSST